MWAVFRSYAVDFKYADVQNTLGGRRPVYPSELQATGLVLMITYYKVGGESHENTM